MFISPITYNSYIYNSKTSSNTSFRAINSNENKNSKESLAIIDKVSKIDVDNISIETMQKFFDVKLLPIEKLQNPIANSVAALDCPLYEENGVLLEGNMVIYIPELTQKNKIGKTLFFMNLAHEYTHACQIKNKENKYRILFDDVKNSGFSLNTFSQLAKYGYVCHNEILQDYFSVLSEKLCSESEKESFYKTGGMILGDVDTDEKTMARALGFSSVDKLKKYIKETRMFELYAFEISKRIPELNEKLKTNYNDTVEKVKNILIKFCAISSKLESEAYYTGNMVAKKFNYDEKGSELCYKFHKIFSDTFLE